MRDKNLGSMWVLGSDVPDLHLCLFSLGIQPFLKSYEPINYIFAEVSLNCISIMSKPESSWLLIKGSIIESFVTATHTQAYCRVFYWVSFLSTTTWLKIACLHLLACFYPSTHYLSSEWISRFREISVSFFPIWGWPPGFYIFFGLRLTFSQNDCPPPHECSFHSGRVTCLITKMSSGPIA